MRKFLLGFSFWLCANSVFAIGPAEINSVEIRDMQTGEIILSQSIANEENIFKGQSDEVDPLKSLLSEKSLEFDMKTLHETMILGLKTVESVLTFLEKRQPEIIVKGKHLSFVPKSATGLVLRPWEMANWSRPLKKSYEIVFKNLYGMKMAKVKFSPTMSYGGSYKGAGKYLQGVQVPTEVFAGWTVKASTSTELISVTNEGAEGDPVIGCMLNLNVKVGTAVTKHDMTYTIYFSANGDIKLL
ncbi:MAG: hypothetical protein HOE90_10945 [Bacteriovoracaceae bacterium]|jgi:hypothetical protein|nr:hypothetical protein [Bacteriovoracaceae bacterium]